MEKSKVYFSDLRALPGTNLPEKLKKLIRKAGIGEIDFEKKMTAIKIHFGEPGNLAFLLPAMGKEELFPTVLHDGALPRKTFSMGEAHDKRFYLEARKIR